MQLYPQHSHRPHGRLVLTLLLATLLTPKTSQARVNPLKTLKDQLLRPDILLILDTSGSMMASLTGTTYPGSDCGGSRLGDVDICGDGLCSGAETTTSCPTDCVVTGPTTPLNTLTGISPAGSAVACSGTSPSPSRMFVTKRVLRNILPQLRSTANFGLAAFAQSGYYTYYKADPSGTAKLVTAFVTAQEMQGMGAWDSSNNRPQTSFTTDGTPYTLLSSSSLAVSADSLYVRQDDSSFEKRFAFSTAGQLYHDGTFTWRYVGSYYTYKQFPVYAASSQLFPEFHGPQFYDGSTFWVYSRIATTTGSVYGSSGGRVVVPINPSALQSDQDDAVREVLFNLNLANTGGLVASGGTPTGPAIGLAHQLFLHRQLGDCSDYSVNALATNYYLPALTSMYPGGSCPYSGQPDSQASCRPRFAVVLSDGIWDSFVVSPVDAAANLYNDSLLSDNPVQTLVLGLPGLPGSARAYLNQIADAGADGVLNNPSCCCSGTACENLCAADVECQLALFADNETDLSGVLWEALFRAVGGDFTTSQTGVASSGNSFVNGDMALVSSSEYPGWRGHLRAWNLLPNPPVEMWDAGVMLSADNMPYLSRNLYTGLSGTPLALFKNGAVEASKIQTVWNNIVPKPPFTPTTAEITAMIEWLAGKSRHWRLDPLVNSTPASVGPPPEYEVVGHADFLTTYAERERLIYVASNDGLLHAFRTESGTEAFAYLPPPAMPALYQLWKQGGQSVDPDTFHWVLASSPRVEDVVDSKGVWTTQLVLTLGPGGKSLSVLDITSPSTYDPDTQTYTLKSSPFSIVTTITDTTIGTTSSIGETWSIPAMFYQPSSKGVVSGVALGSGYGSGTQGHYYNFFDTLWSTPPGILLHDGGGAKVDYAVLAPPAAVIDEINNRTVVAVYQPDLNGRILRYPGGDPSTSNKVRDVVSDSTVAASDPSMPFYFGPAVFFRSAGKTTMAAVSGSIFEEAPPSSADVAKLLMRTDIDGKVSSGEDYYTCAVDDVCTKSGSCFADIPTNCQAPLPSSLPVSSPLLVHNIATNQMEAFYVFYEPSASACQLGNSYVIRISGQDASSSSPRLLSVDKMTGVLATGVALAAGGKAVVVTESGKGVQKAKVTAAAGSISGARTSIKPPAIESWREVK